MRIIMLVVVGLIALIAGAMGGVAGFNSMFPLSDVKARQVAFEPENRDYLYQNMAEVYPVRVVPRGDDYTPLPEDNVRLNEFSFELNGEIKTPGDVFTDMETSGLIVIHNGELVYEKYGRGADASTQLTSWSMVKSITSTLVGVAVADGLIGTVEDPLSKYLPEVVGTAYDGVTIRQAMEMSSGVRFDEDGPAGEDTVAWLTQAAILGKIKAFDGAISYDRKHEPGTVFNYNTAESQVLIELVRRVTGGDAADYLSEKIWKPVGMKNDALWVIDNPGKEGAEIGGAMFNGVLRDWARFGLLIEQDGVWNGNRILPEGWVKSASSSDLPHLQRGEVFEGGGRGYAWHWWTLADGTFLASGANGQSIYVNQAQNVVIARSSAWEDAFNMDYNSYWMAFNTAVSNWLEANPAVTSETEIASGAEATDQLAE